MKRQKQIFRLLFITLIILNSIQVIHARIGSGEYLFSRIVIKGTTNVNMFTINYSSEDFMPFTMGISEEDSLLLSIPVDQFTADSKLMLHDFLKLIHADTYPYIQIILKDIIDKDFFEVSTNIKRKITIGVNGKTNSYFCNTKLQESYHNKWYFSGELNIKLTDFDLIPPEKFLGMIKVQDDVSIFFNILFVIKN